MATDVATFQVRRNGTPVWSIADGNYSFSCELKYEPEGGYWRAWDELGNEMWSQDKPLAAAMLFARRLEIESGRR